ncbi:MAG: hypothetical protein DSY46_06215 [Hydrogenimonas sp.]|nr:MAG: hypothetical protein DSY46_06215 [Hydrogenimonas sp.]
MLLDYWRGLLLTLLLQVGLYAETTPIKRTTIAEWDTGYCEQVTVTNSAQTAWQWNIALDIGYDEVFKYWNALITQERDKLLVQGEVWNQQLNAGASTTFGFCAKRVIERIHVGATTSTNQISIQKEEIAQWDQGFCEEITVTNLTSQEMEWQLIDIPIYGKLIDTWNAQFVEHNTSYTITGEEWNRILKPQQEAIFGYCSEYEQNFATNEPSEPVVIEKRHPIFNEFATGFGGSYAFDFSGQNGTTVWLNSISLILDDNIENNPYYRSIQQFDAEAFNSLQQSLSRTKYVVYWLPKGWQKSWFNIQKIQAAMDKGCIPVFVYWYFGDEMQSLPSDNEVTSYYENCQLVADFLQEFNGTKLVIMEPEFNKDGIIADEATQHAFAKIIGHAIDTIKSKNPDALFSLCMMDTGNRGVNQTYSACGYENCALGDQYEWSKSETVYNDLQEKLDFISFQEMVGQFSRDKQNPGTWSTPIPRAYSDEEIGIDYLSRRIVNFSRFLYYKYQKPVFIPYIAIASATWHDTNGDLKVDPDEVDEDGWEDKVVQTYRQLREYKDELMQNGLFGYATMALFDHPRHNYGGYQFFINNEYHLGIIKTGAKDAVDSHRLGNIQPKGEDLLDALFGENTTIGGTNQIDYERHVTSNEQRCLDEANSSDEEELCRYIAQIKRDNYHEGAIERIDPIDQKGHIFIPLYSYPKWWAGSGSYIWQKIIDVKKRHPDIEVVAIVNPFSGNFKEKNRDFVEGIHELTANGIKVVGYIYTSYGERPLQEVFENIERWSHFYKEAGVQGIFFDETSTDPKKLDFYTSITNYAEAQGLPFTILNPGVTTNQAYIDAGIANVVVAFESPYATWRDTPPSHFNRPSRLTALALLIYNMQGDKVTELHTFAKEHGFTYLYYTEDGEDGNPWDSVSAYTSKEADLLRLK